VLAVQFMGIPIPMNIISIIALVFLGIGGIASAFHLGRPARFFNAFSNFQSHITQEAFITPLLGISLLICSLDGYLFHLGGGSAIMQWLTAILALAFLTSTGLVYQLDARPAWNTPLVLIVFMLTAAQVGALATVGVSVVLTGAVMKSLLVATTVTFFLSLAAQYLFIRRLKGLGYGTAVKVAEVPYRETFAAWMIFGVLAIAVCLAFFVSGGSSAYVFAAILCSIIGIIFWTVLFYKVALKVKMFPMYPVDLNVYV
jgi:anaerobic dimethyl sulfoxide reductase subunit C (anchor subunit)